jgi:flavin reductase (DIM6/NTAB) family NADH-FMN oxidoreductase RutF
MESTQGSIDPHEFRDCCGRFATGITVVTTDAEGVIHGMTANGFMSVSLDPPLIAVSVGNRTRLHMLLQDTRRYGVSILEESQLKLCNHFAGQPDLTLDVSFIQWGNTPLIDGSVAHLVARVVDAHPAGDHTLYIGQVEYLAYQDKNPLIFFGGSFNQLRGKPKWQPATWFDNEVFFFPAGDSPDGNW